MAGQHMKKKRPLDALKARSMGKPAKKQKHYHSDSDEEVPNEQDFDAVNPLSDDDDILGAAVDDGASSGADSDDETSKPQNGASSKSKKQKPTRKAVSDAPAPSDSDSDDSPAVADSDADDDSSDNDSSHPSKPKSKSKRNDPTAFATSLQKILGTKLSASRRADPVLARSADAHEASRRVADSALDAKARKLLREQKRLAQEKGRVRDVLVATNLPVVDRETGKLVEPGEGDGPEVETTASLVEAEKRLRKVAQRGVVKLFNAVRAAQVNAAEAEREVRMQGVTSTARKQGKVTEMSRKGFLDLIASGGGGLKKGPLEEA